MNEEYLKHFSKELSEDIKKYAIDEPLKFSRYIFTHREGKQQFGYCTHCNKEFKTNGLKHNEEITCPKCKSECKVKASGLGRKYMIDEANFEYYEKSVVDPSVITAREIRVTKDYRYNYKNINPKYDIVALYVFQMGKSIMLQSSWYGGGYGLTQSVYPDLRGHLYKLDYRYSHSSIENAVKGTPFQYSTWERYTRWACSMVKFFDLYSKYPGIEYLTKEGFEELVNDKLTGRGTYSAINWNGNSIFKILKLGKADLNEIRTYELKDDSLFLRLYQISKKDKSNLTIKELGKIRGGFGMYFKDMQSVHKYASLRKMEKYISLQRKRNSKYFSMDCSVLSTWKDYIFDCKTLEMSLKDEQILFPKDLYKAHQNTIKQIKFKASEMLNIKISKRVKILEKYKFEYEGLIIRAAESSNELIKEGEVLHHCVGGYAARHADGKTNIMFIRKIDEPNKPYYTLELIKDEIVQIHGKNNRAPEKDVKSFIEAFKTIKLNKKVVKNKITISA